MENAVYDPDSGQLVSASLTERAAAGADIPPLAFETRNVPAGPIRWG
jgi:hypothetical protein